mmetsp:Transcript_13699/g.25982  ORF Transcript_13699/g.25982 Transcript_13699/m.25982 type:complete len:216 (-) Transcript_13699:77-724(-)
MKEHQEGMIKSSGAYTQAWVDDRRLAIPIDLSQLFTLLAESTRDPHLHGCTEEDLLLLTVETGRREQASVASALVSCLTQLGKRRSMLVAVLLKLHLLEIVGCYVLEHWIRHGGWARNAELVDAHLLHEFGAAPDEVALVGPHQGPCEVLRVSVEIVLPEHGVDEILPILRMLHLKPEENVRTCGLNLSRSVLGASKRWVVCLARDDVRGHCAFG